MEVRRQSPKAGEKITIYSKISGEIQAEVKSVSELQTTDSETGWTVWLDINGRDYEYWFTASADYKFHETAGLPYENFAKDFNWKAYRTNTDVQKDTCNAFIKDYVEFRKQGMGLYIYSEIMGSGKTFLACCITNEIMKRYNTPARFITSADYLELERRHEDTRQYQTTALLVLDDLGAQAEKTDFQREALFRLIDGRYKANLSTIYTSNLPFKASSNDDRVFSRVYGSSIAVKLPEESIRQKKADNHRTEFLSRLGLRPEGRLS